MSTRINLQDPNKQHEAILSAAPIAFRQLQGETLTAGLRSGLAELKAFAADTREKREWTTAQGALTSDEFHARLSLMSKYAGEEVQARLKKHYGLTTDEWVKAFADVSRAEFVASLAELSAEAMKP